MERRSAVVLLLARVDFYSTLKRAGLLNPTENCDDLVKDCFNGDEQDKQVINK